MTTSQPGDRPVALDPGPLGFRRLMEEDLALLLRWLNTPHVARWWTQSEPVALDWVQAKYRPRIGGQEPTQPWLITYAARPIGYIQRYRIADYPVYAEAMQLAEAAAGVDLYIGEVDYVGRGLGGPLLRRFLAEIVFADPVITSCIIGPDPANQVAIRAYEKAGFRYLKTIQVPDEPVPEYLMRLARAQALPVRPDSLAD